MSCVDIILSVADPIRFEAAVAEAVALGMQVRQTFPEVGVATGTIDESGVSSLSGVDGLVVEVERGVAVAETDL